ncbi:MAG: methionyl-tRNA formyltransferase [Blautia sp.]|nr:methionyl-tRNA formyltransferase [Blautia sp.]
MITDELAAKRIIYMGTPDFAVPALEALIEEGYQVTGVVTQPDRPKGRGKAVIETPVKQTAAAHDIPVWQPAKVRDPEFVEFISAQKPDMIIVAAFGQIIPKSMLDIPPFGCLNIHGSLLPAYRGASPIQQAVLSGDSESGITIMRMNEGLDTGDIISQRVVPIAPDETGGSLFDKLKTEGAGLLIETLPSVFDGTAVYIQQPEESPTPYAAMLKKQSGLLDFAKSASELERVVRAMDPWPGAYTFLNGKTLKIWKTEALADDIPGKENGTIIKTGPEGIFVKCGSGVLRISELQLEGRKRMDADAFLRGCRDIEGTVLTRE